MLKGIHYSKCNFAPLFVCAKRLGSERS